MPDNAMLEQLRSCLYFSVSVFMQKITCILARATALSTFFTITEMLSLKT